MKRRLFSSLLILLIVFVLVASFYFILHESRHDCSGEDCPVCALVAICRNTIRTISVALILFAISFAALYRCFGADLACVSVAREHTPVSLKVKLLN